MNDAAESAAPAQEQSPAVADPNAEQAPAAAPAEQPKPPTEEDMLNNCASFMLQVGTETLRREAAIQSFVDKILKEIKRGGGSPAAGRAKDILQSAIELIRERRKGAAAAQIANMIISTLEPSPPQPKGQAPRPPIGAPPP